MLTPTVILILAFLLVAIVSFLFGLCWRERHNYTYDQVRAAFWHTFGSYGNGMPKGPMADLVIESCWERFEDYLNEANK